LSGRLTEIAEHLESHQRFILLSDKTMTREEKGEKHIKFHDAADFFSTGESIHHPEGCFHGQLSIVFVIVDEVNFMLRQLFAL
jgi:hypothetical protein